MSYDGLTQAACSIWKRTADGKDNLSKTSAVQIRTRLLWLPLQSHVCFWVFLHQTPTQNTLGSCRGSRHQKHVENKSASEVAVGMFLRLQQSIHLKMQDHQHGNATDSHSTTTEIVSISIHALSYHRCTLEVLSTVGTRHRLVARKMSGGVERASRCIEFRGAGNSGPGVSSHPVNVHNRGPEGD